MPHKEFILRRRRGDRAGSANEKMPPTRLVTAPRA